ncbi:MAG: hypothetical protein HOW73_18030 [Polyangiaceae bacterium]|nr:hypothetical protein [Polyangiaceae bacterium]
MSSHVKRSPDSDLALDDLRALYRDVDQAYAGTSCEATTECCRFGLTGREPYVTAVEMALVRRAVARRGSRARGAGPRPLHETMRELPVISDERACPLLSAEGRCSIYDDRPFGCRTFFCERKSSYAEVKHRELLAFVSRLKQIAQSHTPGGEQGRAFSRALAEIGLSSGGESATSRKKMNKSRGHTSKSSR